MNALQKAGRLCANLLRIGLTNPRRLHYVMGMTLAATEDVADRSLDLLRLPHMRVEDLLPAPGSGFRATLALFHKTNASVSVLEFFTLILLLKRANAASVFEFGTYKGASITQMALNLGPQSRIYTLDLPEDDPRSRYAISSPKDAVIAVEKGKGSLVPADLRDRITFLQQDSATFDETPYAGSIDFVFVDGAHNLDYVHNDSEKGWRMLRPGGIMAWHDCCLGDPDVVRFLLGCPFAPTRVQGTSLAFAVKPAAGR
jgi:hypothetical protein